MSVKKPTMRDIARAVGTSAVTVSKAMAGKPGMSDRLRAKILKKAAEMGYELPRGGRDPRGGHLDIGILIPDTAKEKPQEYTVIALGTGKLDDNGKKIPFDVKVGDVVLTSRYGGTEVKVGDKEYKVVNQDDILAVVG